MHINALLAVLRPPHHYRVSPLQPARLDGFHAFVPEYQHRIHPAFGNQQPLTFAEVEIFGMIGGPVEIVGGNPVQGRGRSPHCRGGGKIGGGEIGGCIRGYDGHSFSG